MHDSEKINDSESGGTGGKSERTASGRTVIQDARMEERAIRNRWISGRWPTDTPRRELIESIRERGDITLKERIILSTYELLEHEDARAKGIGGRIGVAMEKQNQIDQINAVRSGSDQASLQPTTRTPDQSVDLMDESIPFVPDKEAV